MRSFCWNKVDSSSLESDLSYRLKQTDSWTSILKRALQYPNLLIGERGPEIPLKLTGGDFTPHRQHLGLRS